MFGAVVSKVHFKLKNQNSDPGVDIVEGVLIVSLSVQKD